MDTVYITKTRPREWDWPWRKVFLPIPEKIPNPIKNFDAAIEWEARWAYRRNFHVHKKDVVEARVLAVELERALGTEQETKIIARLEQLRTKEPATPAEDWGRRAIQIPDWGPLEGNRKFMRKIVTERTFGRVLDAACGFDSYFDDSPKIEEVIAVDFAVECLELYSHPSRKRILYDLERISKGEKMDFFADGFFDTIGLFFAANYLSDPTTVYREFKRIVTTGGKCMVGGGVLCGYTEGSILSKERFDPKKQVEYMRSAGFSQVVAERLDVNAHEDDNDYYLVEGLKA